MLADLETELNELRARFDALEPEVDEVLVDESAGVEGYVVVWNTSASIGGPLEYVGKGGTRISPSVTRDDVRELARAMTLKNAAAGLPLGGAKSGLQGDPDDPDFETKYRRFVQLAAPLLKSNGGRWGGFGFDLGGRPEHAIWACDEVGRTDCFTGKTLAMGGTDYDAEGIAGLGVSVAATTLLQLRQEDLSNTTFAVQGLGAMGSAVLRYMHEAGAKATFISDPTIGGTWNISSADVGQISKELSARNVDRVRAILEATCEVPKNLSDVLTSEVDVLFPCAMGNVITERNVKDLKCRYLVEAANFPTERSAFSGLKERGIHVVPDIIANPGGAISAYIEMTSDVSSEDNLRERINPERAKAMTRERISTNVISLFELIDEGIEAHAAAELMALRRILKS